MIRARIVGEVWATRQAAALRGRRLKLCAVQGPAGPTGRVVVALDTLDAARGQEVLVAVGSGARNVLQPGPANRNVLCDAAVALLVEGSG